MLSNQSMRASLQVAPLTIGRSLDSETQTSTSSQHFDYHSPRTQLSEMTPPATPDDTREDRTSFTLSSPPPPPPPVFHNFLRAFYPFHPSYALTDSSVTLPLNEGDVVLVHSIHTNGWADGTLLLSGARGWLPTNYCEAYEPDEMANLLKALLNLWDLLRSTSVNDSEIFGNQEFMKGIIAGVRYLLQRTNCLNRESTIVQRSEMLRRCRKSLLSELSSLVKTAKRLQEGQKGTLDPPEDVNDIVDEMILKAFRIVTKGVRFLDVLEDDRRCRAPAAVTVMATVAEEAYVPPTPPADQTNFHGSKKVDASVGADSRPLDDAPADDAPPNTADIINASAFPLPWNKRLSSLNSPVTLVHRQSLNSQTNRLSASMSHRLSMAGPSSFSHPQNLVSERLSRSHDTFLSHLGSFIGRLHLGSQSRPELASAIKRSASSGGELLAVVGAVCLHSNTGSEHLDLARGALFDRIQDLVFSGKDTLVNTFAEEDVIMPSDNNMLLVCATGCVRAAGECVAKTKASVEVIGDFEIELDDCDLGIDLSILDLASEDNYQDQPNVPEHPSDEPEQADDDSSNATDSADASSARNSASSVSNSRRGNIVSLDKPLPGVPEHETPVQAEPLSAPPPPPQEMPPATVEIVDAETTAPRRLSLPPLPKLSTTLLSVEQQSLLEQAAPDHDSEASRSDSLIASSAGSSATYLSRDSEASMVSQNSTRATTPDHGLQPREKPSMSDLSTAGSTAFAEDADDVESRLMEKTFAHELMFNKEGQVTAGSLPALVERLTTHESTPDAIFVSTFFLTFRLFCTPLKLTEALVDRFDYVSESPQVASPVRLRVYNVFKGWLESHWRDSSDRDALRPIMSFAEHKLGLVLPSAGRRLVELSRRVALEPPRLTSLLGKTNTAIASYVPADMPAPAPIVSKAQQNLLNSFKAGSHVPTILDFDPLELARQLTIKQMTIFCAITPDELLSSQWMKNGGSKAPNVKAMSALSTDLSNLVADTILHYSEIKKRAAVIKQWIKVANQCLELHNYDGLLAIVCSLNSSTISRLRKTWDIVSVKRKEMLRTLQEIVEPSQNNKILRGRLHDHVPPCLPFLGMYLTDLTFVDIGNPATKQLCSGAGGGDRHGNDGLTVINFDKHARTAKIIGELQRFQIMYRLTELPDMQQWMTSQIMRVRDGDQGNVQVNYYRKSLLLEPRETNMTKVPSEPTTPTITGQGGSRDNLFAWMSRDRGHHQQPATTTAPL